MWSIGIWGQRGNFLSIPTDCPQRDERLGWMGDAGVFWRTGTYNFDIAAFSQKFMQDIADAQTPKAHSPMFPPTRSSKMFPKDRRDWRAGMGRRRRDRSLDRVDAVRQQGDHRTELGRDAAVAWSTSMTSNPDFLRKKGRRTQLRRLAGARREHEQGFARDRLLGVDREHDVADGARRGQTNDAAKYR